LSIRRDSLCSSSELEHIRKSVEEDSKLNKTLTRRILDAERVARDLSGAMAKIQDACIRFLVRVSAYVRCPILYSERYKQVKTTIRIENTVDDIQVCAI
jgi:hypothetical protein